MPLPGCRTFRHAAIVVTSLLALDLNRHPARAAERQTVTAPQVRVDFEGLPKGHAKAVAQTLSAAREAYGSGSAASGV